jgi:hypothetical protein
VTQLVQHTAPNLMTWYWIFWFTIGFGVPEGIALATRHTEWTLSYQVWTLEGASGSIMQFIVAAFLVWLFRHLVFRDWRTLR